MINIGPKIPVMVSGASGDTYLAQGNAMLRMLQILVQPNVISVGTPTPPGSPSNGDTYVVGSSPSGAWTGHGNSIACWSTDNLSIPSGEWEFYAPAKGWVVGNQSDAALYVYNGTTWVVNGGGAVQSLPSPDV